MQNDVVAPPPISRPSRYETDFEEVNVIGRGGFGSVWKARNRLDGLLYAVKKIKLPMDDRAGRDMSKVFREIKGMSRLDHPNIVRYYSSWLEMVPWDANAESLSSRLNSPVMDATPGLGVVLASEQAGTDSDISANGGEFQVPGEQNELDFSYGMPATAADFSFDIVFESSAGVQESSASPSSLAAQEDDNGSRDASVAFGHLRKQSNPLFDSTASLSRSLPSSSPSMKQLAHYLGAASAAAINGDMSHLRPALFIQMQLCHHSLRAYLDIRDKYMCQRAAAARQRRDAAAATVPRSSGSTRSAAIDLEAVIGNLVDPIALVDSEANLCLFRTVVRAVAYIHSVGLIHRDLSPANIFMGIVSALPASEEVADVDEHQRLRDLAQHQNLFSVVPKIGDFGLVTDTLTAQIDNHNELSVNPRLVVDVQHTGNIGTALYAAPEQLKPSTHGYDSAVDVYALGIILFELYHPFATYMERHRTLSDLRNGIIPEAFARRWPKQAAFVVWLTTANPAQRPSVEDVLQRDLMQSSSDERSLRAQLLQRDFEIISLQERLDSLERTVAHCDRCRAHADAAAREGHMHRHQSSAESDDFLDGAMQSLPASKPRSGWPFSWGR